MSCLQCSFVTLCFTITIFSTETAISSLQLSRAAYRRALSSNIAIYVTYRSGVVRTPDSRRREPERKFTCKRTFTRDLPVLAIIVLFCLI